MTYVERVVYDKDSDRYLVGKLINRDITPKGPMLRFKDACLVQKTDVPTDKGLEIALADIYVPAKRGNLQFLEDSFANKKPVAVIKIDL